MSSFKRDENFKLNLATGLKFLNIETVPKRNDYLREQPEKWLQARKFRTKVIMDQAVAVEEIYKDCDEKNVKATFERIRREIEELHWKYTCGKIKMNMVPVVQYSGGMASKSGKRAEIEFKTSKGKKERSIRLSLFEQPQSRYFPKGPRKMAIRMEVSCKVPEDLKLNLAFKHFLMSGDLLIDFITDKLWPIFLKAEEAEFHQKFMEQVEKMDKLKEQKLEVEKKVVEVEKSAPKPPRSSEPMVQQPTVNLPIKEHRDPQRAYAGGERRNGSQPPHGRFQGGFKDNQRRGSHRGGKRDGSSTRGGHGHSEGPREHREHHQHQHHNKSLEHFSNSGNAGNAPDAHTALLLKNLKLQGILHAQNGLNVRNELILQMQQQQQLRPLMDENTKRGGCKPRGGGPKVGGRFGGPSGRGTGSDGQWRPAPKDN